MLVKYFADIRRLSGREQQEYGAAAPTVRALLEALAGQHGAPFRRRVFDGDRLSSTLIVFVNGSNVEHLAGIETPLGADDVVAIFPMIAGG